MGERKLLLDDSRCYHCFRFRRYKKGKPLCPGRGNCEKWKEWARAAWAELVEIIKEQAEIEERIKANGNITAEDCGGEETNQQKVENT